MKKSKKIIGVIMSLTLVVASIPANSFAADAFSIEDYNLKCEKNVPDDNYNCFRKPLVMLTDDNGSRLREGKDYEVKYMLTDASKGIGDVIVYGINSYKGVKSEATAFKLTKPTVPKITGLTYSQVAGKTDTYMLKWNLNSNMSKDNGDKYEIYKDGNRLAVSTNCTNSYNIVNKSGEAHTYMVRAIKRGYVNSYYGSFSTPITLISTPSKSSISTITTQSNSISVTMNTQACTYYQIQTSTDKTFKKNLRTLTSASKKLTIKSLKKGTSYYIRGRAYTKFNGLIKYGSWTSVKIIKCK